MNPELEFLSSVEIAPDEEPPKEFRIFRAGENKSSKGTFIFDKAAFDLTKKAYDEHGIERLMVDFEHKALDPKAPISERKSAARFNPVWRDDGELWAEKARWTKLAKQELMDGERNHISPGFYHLDGHIKHLVNVSLVNLPSLHNMQPLVAASQVSGEPTAGNAGQVKPDAADAAKENGQMKTLLALMGASTEDDGIAKLNSLNTESTERKELITLTQTASFEEAKGVIQAGVAACSRVKELEELDATREAESKIVKLTALIEKGRAECKLTAAMEDWAKTQSFESLSMFLEHAPKAVKSEADAHKKVDGKTNGAAVEFDGKAWEQLSNEVKHNLAMEKPEVYEALREDFQARKAAGQVHKN